MKLIVYNVKIDDFMSIVYKCFVVGGVFWFYF